VTIIHTKSNVNRQTYDLSQATCIYLQRSICRSYLTRLKLLSCSPRKLFTWSWKKNH